MFLRMKTTGLRTGIHGSGCGAGFRNGKQETPVAQSQNLQYI